ncbi:MAG TPA: hypothetical protein VMT87_05270 [Vicinamibacteria bacterium]|nr:hypothetical protein [Vicinamibacteria bacterium]
MIGGLAVASHGYVRATDDIDVVVSCSLGEARRRLEAAGVAVSALRGDVLEGDVPCLKAILDGIPVDILPPVVPLEWEKAIEIPISGGRLRVVDLEGLFRLKLRAQGVQDVLDVAVLVLRHPEYGEKAREIAAAYRVLDRLDGFLADRRTQATAAEQRGREERPMKPPKRRRAGRK